MFNYLWKGERLWPNLGVPDLQSFEKSNPVQAPGQVYHRKAGEGYQQRQKEKKKLLRLDQTLQFDWQ